MANASLPKVTQSSGSPQPSRNTKYHRGRRKGSYDSRVGNFGLYFLFLIPPMIAGFVIQGRLKRAVASQMQVQVANGMTGEQVARMILDHNGLSNVPVNAAQGAPLSDNYDPRQRTVNLSQGIFDGNAVASAAIAAHEVGHAIQHQKAYTPFRLRSTMFPAVAFASKSWVILLMIGLFANIAGLFQLAIVLFAVVVLFQLVTLPVEFDASRRAKQQLHTLGLVSAGEEQGVSRVLSAAAMTYVAAALAALSQLAYYAMVFGNRN
jgi:Zn-dependent membrane protease YugP